MCDTFLDDFRGSYTGDGAKRQARYMTLALCQYPQKSTLDLFLATSPMMARYRAPLLIIWRWSL
jgi:hypothetical protein